MRANVTSHPSGPRVLHLDGLRGLAVIAVIVTHFFIPHLSNEVASIGAYLSVTLTLAYTGVDLFFVLSGYLIGGILLEHLESPRLMPAFYIRRAARILPLGFLCIFAAVSADAWGISEWREGGPPWPLPVYLSFSTNLWMAQALDWGFRPLSHLWSLGIEEQFYLLVPILIRLVPVRRIPWMIGSLIIFAPVSRWLIVGQTPDHSLAAGMLPFCRSDGLGLGMLVAWIVRSPAAIQWCRNRSGVLVAILAATTLGCILLTKVRAGNGSFLMAMGGYSVVALFYAAILLYLELNRDGRAARMLTYAPLRLIGRYSYFLYLFQGLIICLAVGVFFHGRFALVLPVNLVQVLVGLTALVGTSALSWRYLESPILILGRRFSY